VLINEGSFNHTLNSIQGFEGPSKIVIGLERLMLEAANFDFRNRYPQKHLIKLAKLAGLEKDVSNVAYNMMIDLYKTYAPLKQTCASIAFACCELATLILERQQTAIRGPGAPAYEKWCTSRPEVIETILDLLDLYTHFQKSTIVGPPHSIEKFLQIRLRLNQEVEQDSKLSRFTQQQESSKTNGFKLNGKTPKTPVTPASPADMRVNGAPGTNGKDGTSPATMSPRSASSSRKAIGPKDGTVRFMLDAAEAKQENATVDEYYKVEYEEFEIEVEEPIKKDREERGPRPGPRNDRNDRGHYHNKRIRR
jgi:CTD kinase subunit beta